jgi:hypothetical protein
MREPVSPCTFAPTVRGRPAFSGSFPILRIVAVGALLSALPSCKAESLGIPIQHGGEEAINQEDLQRDTFQIVALERNGASRAAGTPAARQVANDLTYRMQEMHLIPAFATNWQQDVERDWNVCGLRDGKDSRPILFAAIDGGRGADLGASPVAALVSLAKAEDGQTEHPRSELFCRVAPAGGEARLGEQPPVPWGSIDRIVVLGPLGGTELTVTDSVFAGHPALLATTGPDPVHGTDGDVMGRIDFRRLAANTVELHRRFLGDQVDKAREP